MNECETFKRFCTHVHCAHVLNSCRLSELALTSLSEDRGEGGLEVAKVSLNRRCRPTFGVVCLLESRFFLFALNWLLACHKLERIFLILWENSQRFVVTHSWRVGWLERLVMLSFCDLSLRFWLWLNLGLQIKDDF